VRKAKLLLSFVLLAALVGGAFVYFRDTDGPTVELAPDSGPVSARTSLALRLADTGVGLKGLQVTAVQGVKSFALATASYPEGTPATVVTLDLSEAQLQEGPFELRVAAVDRSPFHFGKGNTTELSFRFDYDNRPPAVSVLSTAHNINQGGVGLVVYTVSEAVSKTGVTVGDSFFPGHRQPSGTYAALFAFPYDMDQSTFVPKVLAVDLAGNERQAGIYYHTNPRPFPTDRIVVSDKFLETKIVPDFQHFYPTVTDPLELFLKVNRELRAQNAQTLFELGRRTADQPLWEGVFLRQPNAAVPGFFAQARTYYYKGEAIDRQTHLGVDLASTAQAPVPAANAGKVVYADELGIYGNCVIVDHGLGLQTLYAHLSQIAVKEDDAIGKGEIVGRTGATGMAGGDHLHFSVLVAGRQVNPLEWWDPNWLKNNVTGKLALAGR